VTTWLEHGHVRLALHALRGGEGRPLLRLHALGAHSDPKLPPELEAWPGPVAGLDFTGHGASSLPRGGGYTAEILMSDVDVALAHLGPATLVGEGLGAYVALLVCGARPKLVRGAILCDGPGLAGGGPWPGPTRMLIASPSDATPDPFAILELSSDIRPPDYVADFLSLAVAGSGLPRPISVCATERPAWLQSIAGAPGTDVTSLAEAIAHYASVS
jgi:pimeloyl-ACP methyl ester carboxylesterase